MYQKNAIVTGSSKGIGAAIAKRLAAGGYRVYVTYSTDRKGADEVARFIVDSGGSSEIARLDVRDPDSVSELFASVEQREGHLDILVNNAVQELSKPIDEATLDEWETVLDTKLVGAFLCTKAALPLFAKASSPSMIALSTFEAQQPGPEFVAYGVANAGIDAFVKAMAQFLPKFGARCNAVCPGPVPTPLWGPDESNAELWADLDEKSPVGRSATPEDVAEIVHLIATESTRMLNGNFVYVNGGNHLRQA